MGTFVGMDTVTLPSYIVVSDAVLPESPYDADGTDMDAAEASADRISAMRKVALYPPPDIFIDHEPIHIVPYISASRHAAISYTMGGTPIGIYAAPTPQSSY